MNHKLHIHQRNKEITMTNKITLFISKVDGLDIIFLS